jgi:phage terminase large subunit-like protein
LDEIREQRDWAAWSALSKTTMARPDGQIWAISNAGDDESVVLNHLREAALSGRDPSIGLFEWSAADGCDLDDPEAWAQANPGLGLTVSEQAIRSALATDPPAVFRTEVLCQKVDALDSAVDLAAWRACADAAGSLESSRDRVVACVDVAPDSAHVTLVASAVMADGRVRVEVVAGWESTDAARFELPAVLERVKPVVLAWFPSGPAAALAVSLRGLATLELKGAAVGEACQGFADLVSARRIVHPDDPLLNAHISGAQKYRLGDGWRFARRDAGHVDAVYAAAGAVHAALTMPAQIPRSKVW